MNEEKKTADNKGNPPSSCRQKPTINKSEVYRYLSLKTGLSYCEIEDVFECYAELVYECMMIGVEVPLPNIMDITFYTKDEQALYTTIHKNKNTESNVVLYTIWRPKHREPFGRIENEFKKRIEHDSSQPMSDEAKQILLDYGKTEEELEEMSKNATRERKLRFLV